MQMKSAFPSTRFSLMVGIGGGVPSEEADIRLGDVVVSIPHDVHSGVVQYDLGKTTLSGFERTGSLNAPPAILLNAVTKLDANHILEESKLLEYHAKFDSLPNFKREAAGSDILFEAKYNHAGGTTCGKCNKESAVARGARGQKVVVHHGTIASGNQVMKDAAERDSVSAELGGVLCFEMEAAGLMNSFPCLVIRGVCDYADSHKNKQWQAYAAGTAAAYAKELLSVIPVAAVMRTCRAEDAMNGAKRDRQSRSPDRDSRNCSKIEILSSTENDTTERRNQERTRTLLSNEHKRSLLESLRFKQIDARQSTIKTAHAKTCRWLLDSSQYLAWLDEAKLKEHHGFLWIKGKAGMGKSTLMKFVWANARKDMKGSIVLSFFFNARGEDIEKSIIGTYRSLLLQLLELLPPLQSVFDSLGLTSKSCADHRWNVESLKTLLEQAIERLGHSSVVCFIDALDECEEDQVRDMIKFFEGIGELAISKNIRFRVCFSSRHYPHITIRNRLELVLEGQEGHTQDISNYIKTELIIGESKTAQQIRVKLQEKASGIFMWVVLVVAILNKESDRGKVHTLQQKLQEIPSDLHELFRDILTRDENDKEELVLCVQWVLFTKQPLSPEQLYHAIYSGTDPTSVIKGNPEDITKDVIKRFILSSSKGLAEITVTKEPKVQFIHESVRDFLLKANSLGKIWPQYKDNFHGQSHERLKQGCLNYIRLNVATPLKISDSHLTASSEQAATTTQMFPFLEYAVHNVLYHADKAEGGGISQASFLDSFPIPHWVKLDNLFAKHKVSRHNEQVSLLYLLAELNMANLISAFGAASRCMDVEAERYGCPLFAAAAMSSKEALNVCMKFVEVQQADGSTAPTVVEQQLQDKSAQRATRRRFRYSKTKNFLLNAAELGHDGLLAFLVRSRRFKIELKNSTYETVLWLASKNGCGMAVRSLLDAGSAMNSKNTRKHTLFHVPVEQGHEVVVRMLLELGAEVNAQGIHYSNALQAASHRGSKELVTLLLDNGANINAQGGDYSNALQAALHRGSKELVTLLLDNGANINAQYGDYGNALQAALVKGSKEIVTLLLDKGANINMQGGYYGNALQAASHRGSKELVTLLLDNGAKINAQGGDYGNALQAALVKGSKEIVTLLLDEGANINVQGGYYGNALQAASVQGREEIVTLLLDKGANINAQGGDYGNALQAASRWGSKEIVTLLLDKGANVNAQGGAYSNALQAASVQGREEIITLLLDKGANVNAQGGHYGNALQAASHRGYEEVITLLLDRGAKMDVQGGK
ncbi:hypothetical protein N0V90_013542 [Kalmusia sp. IMI 367209]|nr:hypothetical protein N0V90_013542 [Kalmusia sp. IMI 367209]